MKWEFMMILSHGRLLERSKLVISNISNIKLNVLDNGKITRQWIIGHLLTVVDAALEVRQM